MPNCSSHLKSLSDFETYRDAPEAFAYFFYSIVKLLVIVCYTIVVVNKYTCRSRCCSNYIFCIANDCIFSCWKWIINQIYVIVGAVFGAPLGIVERSSEEYKQTRGHSAEKEQHNNEDDEVAACLVTVCVPRKIANEQSINESTEMRNASCACEHHPEIINKGTETLYIREKKLETNEVLVLAAVTVPFLVAITTTFWDRYSLEETYSCTEDPEIYCFPLAIAPTTNADLNITHSTPKISDCSIWMTSDISANVTFRCFKCVNNLQDAIAALGGLLSIFKVVIKMGFAILLGITSLFIKLLICCKCTCCPPEKARFHFTWIRIGFAVILAVIEVIIGFIIGSAYALHLLTNGTLTDHDKIEYKIFEHLNEPLVVLGIVTTSLLLPLEKYVPIQKKENYNTVSGDTEPLNPITT